MSVSISSSMNYTLKPTSVRCNRKQLVLPASNKTDFAPGDVSVFYLPSLARHVMDGQSGYLRFTVTPTKDSFVDNNASCFLNRITTYGAGGQLIDDIQHYNVISTIMTDLQLSQSDKVGLSQVLGTEDTYFTPTTKLLGWATANTITSAEVSAMTPNSNRKGMELTGGESYTFCIPLVHPLFTLSEKYWPSFALSDDTRLEITWETVVSALVTAEADPNYEIENPEIVVDFIELDDAVLSLVKQTYTGRDLVIPAQTYHLYSSQIASGTSSNISQIVPAKQMSARAFFFAFRPAETQVQEGYSISSRENPFYDQNDQFNLNIGGTRVPQHPIRTRVAGEFSEWFASTQTALHSFNSLEMNGNLNRTYYGAQATNTGHKDDENSFQNGFVLGVNLDSLRGNSTQSNSGINLSGVTTYWEGYLATPPKNTSNANESVTVDAFLLHDTLIVINEAGQCMVKW